jgi:hypothetical protein
MMVNESFPTSSASLPSGSESSSLSFAWKYFDRCGLRFLATVETESSTLNEKVRAVGCSLELEAMA